MFEFNYRKNNNEDLFKSFEDPTLVNVVKAQNYIPLYSDFFSLNSTNWNSINLNNSKIITSVHSKIDDNIYSIGLKGGKTTTSFFKFSPIIDPIKYMYGKYKDISNDVLFNIPTLEHIDNNNSLAVHEKTLRKNNVSYIDGFFSFLTSKLKHEHNFLNGIEYYGGFLGVKRDFKINIYDELEYLTESSFFYENNNKLFVIDEDFSELFDNESRKNKNPLKIPDSNVNEEDVKLETNDLSNEIDELFIATTTSNEPEKYLNLSDVEIGDINTIYKYDLPDVSTNSKETASSSSETTCSSRTSHTSKTMTILNDDGSISNNDSNNDSDNDSDSGSDSNSNGSSGTGSDSYSTISDENVTAVINEIPVKIICLEKMEQTLDNFMMNNDLADDEWKSILSQIIFTLLTYQKAFEFTHNDLHTNNIMFINTDIEHIVYKFNNEYYKVPTFGKIWKIIDFGRAIYTFKGKQIISDSYHKDEDASTLYNCGLYYNSNKPLLNPNYSFDLSRLGCSLFDFFFDNFSDIKDIEKDDELSRIVNEWCTDDNKKNILYKDNDKDRYPGFKLYKMIARNVHKHTPENQLKRPFFKSLKIRRKMVNKKTHLVNIDKIVPL